MLVEAFRAIGLVMAGGSLVALGGVLMVLLFDGLRSGWRWVMDWRDRRRACAWLVRDSAELLRRTRTPAA